MATRKKVVKKTPATSGPRARASSGKGVVSKAGAPSTRGTPASEDVDAFMRELDHPLKKEIEAIRRIILGASSTIGEGIKWKAPSFRTTDDFATVNLRSTDCVQVIFHTGAKVKSYAKTGIEIDDPANLLSWLAKDRAMMTLADAQVLRKKRAAIIRIVRAWIQLL
ncbi:MAG: DUF1801 domain-containing protein [Phycisphaerales bacterium]|nr:DUF1801 domain-containing protein [Phycisphaerales bacterium]